MAKEEFVNVLRVSVVPDGEMPNYTIKSLKMENTLHKLYETLGCEMVEVVTVNIDGKEYDIWCDEEALCKCPIPEPVLPLDDDPTSKNFRVLFGPVLFANCNEDGEMASLSEEDEEAIRNWVKAKIYVLRKWLYIIQVKHFLNSLEEVPAR